jgi:hypothetical protein
MPRRKHSPARLHRPALPNHESTLTGGMHSFGPVIFAGRAGTRDCNPLVAGRHAPKPLLAQTAIGRGRQRQSRRFTDGRRLCCVSTTRPSSTEILSLGLFAGFGDRPFGKVQPSRRHLEQNGSVCLIAHRFGQQQTFSRELLVLVCFRHANSYAAPVK